MAGQHDPIQHGWMVHQAVQTWTNQSETKASVILGIEAALFVFFGERAVDPGEDVEREVIGRVPVLLLFSLGLVCLSRRWVPSSSWCCPACGRGT